MSKNKRTSVIFRVIILSFVIGGLSGCVKNSSGGSSSTSNISFITLMNMAPNAPSTEVYFNSIKQTSAISAGSYSSNYGQVPAGVYDVVFKAAGKDSAMSEVNASLYDSLAFYTLILYNQAGYTTANSMKIIDDFSTLSVSMANYRFFQLSPDVPPVDLYLNSSAVQNGRTLADNANSTFYNSFQPLTPGVYTITAKKAGSDSVIATASSVSLSAASAYTVFLQGSKTNTSNPIALKVLLASY